MGKIKEYNFWYSKDLFCVREQGFYDLPLFA